MKLKRIKKRRKKTILSDICLIVHGNVLLHAKHQNLVAQHDESMFRLTPTELAAAARRLLPLTTKRQRIALALPSSEFVATSLNLPEAATQNLKNVVNLQLQTLLPGVTEPMLVAVEAPLEGEETYALWLPVKRAEELWQAFEQVGLNLNCILPRPLVVLPRKSTSCQIYDQDDNTITSVEWSKGVIQSWLHLPTIDHDNPEFQTQLEDALSTQNSQEQKWKTNLSDWEKLPVPAPAAYDYAFIPPSAAARMAQEAQKRKRRWLSFAALLVIASIAGGIYYAIDYQHRLEQYLIELKKRTLNISRLRAEAGEIEQIIGPIKNFPRQNVVYILESLDKLIPKNSWLVSFRIEGGVIKLEGYSPNPTALVEKLTKEPRIYHIEQSRGTTTELGRNELRFGFSFKLKNFDLAAYWLEYFPKKR